MPFAPRTPTLKGMKMKSFLSVLLSIVVTACGIYKSKTPAGSVETLTLHGDEIGYAQVKSQVFGPSCVRCHNSVQADAGVALDSYASVKANLGLVKNEAVDNRSMPPEGPLAPARVQLLSDWIANGAPEIGVVHPSPTVAPTATPSGTGSPTPAPSATPGGRVVYQDVKDQVFTASCTRCHSGSRPSAGIGLDTYVKVKAHLGQVQSTVLERKSMPPARPIPTPQQQLLKQWIDQGAPETSLDPKPLPAA